MLQYNDLWIEKLCFSLEYEIRNKIVGEKNIFYGEYQEIILYSTG